MSKKREITINNYNLEVDDRGDVYFSGENDGVMLATAKEVEQIAARSAFELKRRSGPKVPTSLCHGDYPVTPSPNEDGDGAPGSVWIGCQCVSAKQISRIAKLCRALRQRRK